MATKMNTLGNMWRKRALKKGIITEYSTSQPFAYDISRHWRRLLKSGCFRGEDGYDAKEREIGDIIASSIRYLKVKNPDIDIDRLISSRLNED